MSIEYDPYAQEVVKLYPGKAPGSESWNWKEQDLGGGYLRDVVDPSLTIFRPEHPNGIAVVVSPGGAYHFRFQGRGGRCDQLIPINHSIQLASKWLEAKQPVEIHIYQKGNHGFVGNPPQNSPVDKWFDRLSDWIFMLYPQTK